MAGTRKRASSTAHKGTAGKRKTAQRKVQSTKRQRKATGDHHRVAGERSGPAKHSGKSVRSSNKKRAAKKGETLAMKPKSKRVTKKAGADVTEFSGPPADTKNTRAIEPKRVPKTGIAKKRSR